MRSTSDLCTGAWRVYTNLTVDFCLEVVEQAMREIFNIDQDSQFSSQAFVQLLAQAGIVQSMDGKGRRRDNSLCAVFRRSIKCEEVYLHGYGSVSDAKAGIGHYVNFYNAPAPAFLAAVPLRSG